MSLQVVLHHKNMFFVFSEPSMPQGENQVKFDVKKKTPQNHGLVSHKALPVHHRPFFPGMQLQLQWGMEWMDQGRVSPVTSPGFAEYMWILHSWLLEASIAQDNFFLINLLWNSPNTSQCQVSQLPFILTPQIASWSSWVAVQAMKSKIWKPRVVDPAWWEIFSAAALWKRLEENLSSLILGFHHLQRQQ